MIQFNLVPHLHRFTKKKPSNNSNVIIIHANFFFLVSNSYNFRKLIRFSETFSIGWKFPTARLAKV